MPLRLRLDETANDPLPEDHTPLLQLSSLVPVVLAAQSVNPETHALLIVLLLAAIVPLAALLSPAPRAAAENRGIDRRLAPRRARQGDVGGRVSAGKWHPPGSGAKQAPNLCQRLALYGLFLILCFFSA